MAEGRTGRVVSLMTPLSCSISHGVTYFQLLHQQIMLLDIGFFFFNIKNFLFIYLFLAVLGLCCCGGSSLVAAASLVAEHGL